MAKEGRTSGIVLLALFCLIGASSYSFGQDLRTVKVKLVLDSSLGTISSWRDTASLYFHECAQIFKDQFGIKLEIRKYGYWYPDPWEKPLTEAMNDLKNRVPPQDCDLVLGLISPEHTTPSACGVSTYFHGYILLKSLQSGSYMKHFLLHELCHIFGAVDLKEKDSIMSSQDIRPGFDAFTRQAVLLHRLRSFDRTSLPLSKENLDQAVALYEGRRKLNLGETGLSFLLTYLYLEKEDYDAATLACSEVIKANPASFGIHNMLANILVARGEVDRAIAEYQIEMELDPGEAGTHLNLGQAWTIKGMFEKAMGEYRNALQLNPHCAQAHYCLGYLHFRSRELDKASAECRAALKIDPALTEAMSVLAAALVLLSEPLISRLAREGAADQAPTEVLHEAIALCQKAISLKSGISEVHNTLGVAYAYLRRYDEAAQEFLRALEIRPNLIIAHYNVSLLCFSRGAMEVALFHLGRILEIDPTSEIGRQIKARAFQAPQTYLVVAEDNKN